MAVSLSNVQVRDWFQRQRDSIQPWAEFLNTKKFKMPKSVAPVGPRLIKNVNRFQSNYLFVFLGLLLFCLYDFLLHVLITLYLIRLICDNYNVVGLQNL